MNWSKKIIIFLSVILLAILLLVGCRGKDITYSQEEIKKQIKNWAKAWEVKEPTLLSKTVTNNQFSFSFYQGKEVVTKSLTGQEFIDLVTESNVIKWREKWILTDYSEVQINSISPGDQLVTLQGSWQVGAGKNNKTSYNFEAEFIRENKSWVMSKLNLGKPSLNKDISKEELKKLKAEVKELDSTFNVKRRKYIDTYFRLGDAYSYLGKTAKAKETYKKGLRLNAERFNYQFKLAKLDFKSGSFGAAKERFSFIVEYSSDKKLRQAAEVYLNTAQLKKVKSRIEIVPNMSNYTLYVTQFGEVSPLYLEAVKARLVQEFKINVEILDDTLTPVKKGARDKRERYFNRVVAKLRETVSKERFFRLLQQLGISGNEKLTKQEKKKLVHWLYLQEENGEEQWQKVLKQLGIQYNAAELLKQLKEEYQQLLEQDQVLGVLGVTGKDIYANDLNFLFGYAGPGAGVISYQRFVSKDTPVDTAIKRVVMQAFSSTGYIIGIPRCTTPNCSRAYPHSLKEHDKKEDILCAECIKNLAKRYQELLNN